MSQPAHCQAGREEVPLEQGGLSNRQSGEGAGQVRPFSQDHRQASGSHSQSVTSPCSLLSVPSPDPTGPGAEPAAENPACRAPPTSKDLPHFCCPPPAAVLRLWGRLALTHLSPAPSGRRPCHPRGPSREVPSPAPPPPLLGPGKNGGDMGLSSLRTFIQSILTEHSLCPVPRWTPGRPQ